MPEQKPYYRVFLESELSRRCRNNPAYSLRSFARALNLNASVLSRIMTGKRILSVRTAGKLTELLNMRPGEAELFLQSSAEAQKASKLQALMPMVSRRAGASGPSSGTDVGEISLDQFQAISDLSHIAILELTFVDGFKPDPVWIAETLGISPVEARVAVERLLRLGLLERVDGTLRKAHKQLTTTNKDKTTAAHKFHQEQILAGALRSLRSDPIERRNMTGMTMAVDPERLDMAKIMIQQFMDNLCSFLEGGRCTQVYQLGVSLYPLQKLDECVAPKAAASH